MTDVAKPNFVSGQVGTCALRKAERGGYGWSYVCHGDRVVTAGMPSGADPRGALDALLEWCEERGQVPLLFGCEQADLAALDGWSVTEIGRQPLFRAGPDYDPCLSGPDQPASHRKLRRQARRALAKGVVVEELGAAELWALWESGSLDPMLVARWKRRGLPDFSFLVEFRLEAAGSGRRAFLVRSQDGREPLGLIFLVPSRRGWLLEHQIVAPTAPNGTAELALCRLLSIHLEQGTLLSLGLTPLYRELAGERGPETAILDDLPNGVVGLLLSAGEPFYGFRRLLHFRRKLEPERWEPVYWAVPRARRTADLIAVLRAFAGGSFIRFAGRAVEKRLHTFALEARDGLLLKLNLFYIVTLTVWIPILWNIDSIPLFGNAEASKVWALYDLLLLVLFALQQRALKNRRATFVTDLLLGLVTADTVLAWIQTAMYHGGLPQTQPLGAFVFLINTAPISALAVLMLIQLAYKPIPFRRQGARRNLKNPPERRYHS